MLSSNPEAEVVTHAAMGADLAQSVQVFSHLEVKLIRYKLGSLAVLEITLAIEKVVWNLELAGVLDDCDDAIDLFIREGAGALSEVDVGLLED